MLVHNIPLIECVAIAASSAARCARGKAASDPRSAESPLWPRRGASRQPTAR